MAYTKGVKYVQQEIRVPCMLDGADMRYHWNPHVHALPHCHYYHQVWRDIRHLLYLWWFLLDMETINCGPKYQVFVVMFVHISHIKPWLYMCVYWFSWSYIIIPNMYIIAIAGWLGLDNRTVLRTMKRLCLFSVHISSNDSLGVFKIRFMGTSCGDTII